MANIGSAGSQAKIHGSETAHGGVPRQIVNKIASMMDSKPQKAEIDSPSRGSSIEMVTQDTVEQAMVTQYIKRNGSILLNE